ncbi:MAG TPA: efflux RND transporter periplasmic adaptor subunit [Candidatus Hypogeohydataceae bacterium YC40]
MKKLFIILAIVIPIVATASTVTVLKLKKESVNYRTAKVERGDITAVVSASGTLHPPLSTQTTYGQVSGTVVGSQVSGIVKEVYVDFDSVVKEGQLLARIDPLPFETKVKQAKANLEIARAKVSSARASIAEQEAKMKDAQRIYNRLEALFKDGVATEQERDTAKANYDMAAAELESAKAQYELAVAEVEQAKATLASTEVDLGYTYIYSPVDGVVLSRNVDVGQTVAAAFQTPTLFIIARDLRELEAHLDVNEADVGGIKPGQRATFYVTAYPGTTFDAKVVEVRNYPRVTQNVVTYDVVLKVDNKELKLKPGMTANATIFVAEKKNVLKIPNTALRFRPPKESEKQNGAPPQELKGSQHLVYTLKGKGELKPLIVDTGISDDKVTEMVEGNLKEGDQVVVGVMASKKEPGMPRRIF